MAMIDMEFEKLKTLLPHLALNTTAAHEHVREIEREIRVIKVRARGTFKTLPYMKLPKMMVLELLHFINSGRPQHVIRFRSTIRTLI